MRALALARAPANVPMGAANRLLCRKRPRNAARTVDVDGTALTLIPDGPSVSRRVALTMAPEQPPFALYIYVPMRRGELLDALISR